MRRILQDKMKLNNLLVLMLIKTLLSVSNCSEASCHCNPIFHIGTESSFKSENNQIVTVTSQLQADLVKQIFENVSIVLLDNQIVRFQNLLKHFYIESRPTDCQDLQTMGFATSGVYKIFPNGTHGFSVRCDQDTDGGGWTVFQRRTDGKEDFYRGWFDYQIGFGNLEKEFWLGNQQLYMITSQGRYELRVDLILNNGSHMFAKYNVFYVKGIDEHYRIYSEGYSGTAGDSLAFHLGMNFTTKDRDNDNNSQDNCAQMFHGAWWYNSCHYSNLNGLYGATDSKGIIWHYSTGWHESASRSEMKIRRLTQRKKT